MATPPRRSAVVELLSGQRRALHASEIASRLGVEPRAYGALQRVLDDLCFDGTLASLSGQRFRLAAPTRQRFGAAVEGVLVVNPRGFGFVQREGLDDDLFVPAEAMGGAMHGDRVAARVTGQSSRGLEGSIERVVERRNPRIVGVLRTRGRATYLEPDDTRVRGPIVLSDAPSPGVRASEGDAVLAVITRFPEEGGELPEGRLEAVFGRPGEPRVEVEKVLAREGVELSHPADAELEAQAFPAEVSSEALEDREDLTSLPLPTIDPEDARDHDDAVWVERTGDGNYRVVVAIADVSHYVRPGTALDAEALTRGNSVYLPDRVIPMLPPALSSHLCSLVPHELRLCLAVEMIVDPTGTTVSRRVMRGFMRSAAKLTYPGVARALGLTTEPPRSPEAEALLEPLTLMWDLARVLRARRMRRGALDFDLPEAQVVLDPETGAPTSISPRKRDPGIARAYQLVEELMLLANETVAGLLVESAIPTVFRVHASPDGAKLERFAALCEELRVEFDPEDAAHPKRLGAFLKRVASHPKRTVLHMMLMRSMKQAVYDVHNIGHFGLASPEYLHFTSPIRRYPDLLVHRAVKKWIAHDHSGRGESAVEALREAAAQASRCERRGMEIEREIVDVYRACFMRPHVGSIMEGMVTAVVSSGIFVAIEDPFVDVLVPMNFLGTEDYELDENGLAAVGLRSGERIRLGDRMMIEITDAVIARRTVYGRRLADPGHGRRARTTADRPEERSKRQDRRTREKAHREAERQRKKARADKKRGKPKNKRG